MNIKTLLFQSLLIVFSNNLQAKNDSSWRFHSYGVNIQHRISPTIVKDKEAFKSFFQQPIDIHDFTLQTSYSPVENYRIYLTGIASKEKHRIGFGIGFGETYHYFGQVNKQTQGRSDTTINTNGANVIRSTQSTESYNVDLYSSSFNLKLSYQYEYGAENGLAFFFGAGTEATFYFNQDHVTSRSIFTGVQERDLQDSSLINSVLVDAEIFELGQANFTKHADFRLFGLMGIEYKPFYKRQNLKGIGLKAQIEPSAIWTKNRNINPQNWLHIQYGIGLTYTFL